MTKLSDKILETIKERHIKPKARVKFILKQIGLWFLIVLALLFFGLSLALFSLAMFDINWQLQGPINLLFTTKFFWFWLVAVVAVGAIFFKDIRLTKYGYRYKAVFIVTVLLLVGVVVGVAFRRNSVLTRIDSGLSGMPFYQNNSSMMIDMWNRPNDGLLAGQVVAVESSDSFTLKDFNGQEWTVSAHKAIWRHNMTAEVGLEIKLIGTRLGSNGFDATDIRPWNGGQGCGMMGAGKGSNIPVCGTMK
jgi:hypothetical protein